MLDTIQTLVRDSAKDPVAAKKALHAISFVIAADGAWIRRSYEIAYTDFAPSVATPGRSLGYQYLDKLFQLRVPVPTIDQVKQQEYLRVLYRVKDPDISKSAKYAEEQAVRQNLQRSSSEAEIVETLNNARPEIRSRIAGAAVEKLSAPDLAEATEHRLQQFAPLLEPNPRAMKRFVNDYSILRAVRTLEGNAVQADPLALWAVIELGGQHLLTTCVLGPMRFSS